MVEQGIKIAIRGFEKFALFLDDSYISTAPEPTLAFPPTQHEEFERTRFSIWPWNTTAPFDPIAGRGRHWGLIVFDKENATGYYFDSLPGDEYGYTRRRIAIEANFRRFLQDAGILPDIFGFSIVNAPRQVRWFTSGIHVIESVRAFFHEQRLENWHQSLLYIAHQRKNQLATDSERECQMIRYWSYWSGAAFRRYGNDPGQ
ncbi:hypothetical protein HD806DRAFT_409474 [Xylariaceae sp. AK1471]|nr:hypothetical protein HD806DRAFT_409474 [Xylariaceae sp. AK1471]